MAGRRWWTHVLVALALVALGSARAHAQPKTDVVVLTNGDRITGEIMSLARGRLELKTDDAGTIDIEWDNVARVTSTRQFEVETSDGQRLLGHLTLAGDRNVGVESGGGVTALPMPDVIRIAPIGASFWRKLDGSVDAGFSYTRSSGVAQVNLNGDVSFRRPAFVVHLDGSATLTEQREGDHQDDRAATELSYVRYIGRTLFVSGGVRFESNESLGLLLRSQYGGAVGQRLVSTNRGLVTVGGGVVGNDERGVDTAATQNIEGLLVFNASYFSYDTPKTNVDAGLQYYPSFSTWGRQRVQIDTKLQRDLWKDLYASLNVYFSFDSAPPNADARRSDLGVTFSLGWTF